MKRFCLTASSAHIIIVFIRGEIQMGLFDDLKNSAMKKIVNTTGNTIGNALGKAINSKIENALGAALKPNSKPDSSRENSPQPAAAVQPEVRHNDSVNIDQKFDQILASEFSGLQVMKNVSPGSVGVSAPQPCKPYSYALLRNGKIAAAIMLTPHNRDRNAAFLNARKSALDAKIGFLNFYTHFANERNYVITRIKNAL